MPREIAAENVNFNTGLVFRSDDMITRIRVDVRASTDDPKFPYQITFHNLHVGDRGGNKPIELQHGNSGYIWIDGGHSVSHLTAHGHVFNIRDVQKSLIASINLWDLKPEL